VREAAEPSAAPDTGPRLAIAGLVALFVAGLVPLAATFFLFHSDERRYMRAAIAMLQTGDYLVPVDANGLPRLIKPIVSYWLVAATYQVMGVGVLASRLAFLACGAGIVLMTYPLALALNGRRRVALLATAIVLVNPQVVLASVRAIPDARLCLCMTISAWGFARLLVANDRSTGAYWAAYVGAALGVATKGLWPVVLVVFAAAFAGLAGRGGRERLRGLIHLPSMLTALAMAGWWYGWMVHRYGVEFLGAFAHDQHRSAGAGVERHLAGHVAATAWLLAVNLLPWALGLLAVLVRDRWVLVPGDPRSRRALAFAGGWAALVVVIVALPKHPPDERYLLPTVPLLAAVIAEMLDRRPAGARILRALSLLAVGLLVVSGVLLAINVAEAAPGRAGAVLALALGAAGVLGAAGRRLSPAVVLALALFVHAPLAWLALDPIVGVDAELRKTGRVIEAAADGRSAPVVGRPEQMSANFTTGLQVTIGGRVHLVVWSPAADRAAWPRILLLRAADAARLDLAGYAQQPVLGFPKPLPTGGFVRALVAGGLRRFVDSHRERLILAIGPQ